MPKIAYIGQRFRESSLNLIDKANVICAAYAQAGYNLTLRQLYYQFVSRAWISNSMESYKRLGSIVNDARLAGLIDWSHLEDRTRNLQRLPQWDDVEHIMYSISTQFRTRMWEAQPEYVEVWVEKEALADVVSRPADRWLVPYFPCRGYVSQSEMWSAGQRLLKQERNGKPTVIIHLGDHDPSGIDMSRDIRDRLHLFGSDVHVIRIALNMDQVEQYSPPPNPAKLTDSRANEYVENYGYESWELDALDPATLDALIEGFILEHLDRPQWDADEAGMQLDRQLLTAASENWSELAEYIRDNGWLPAAGEEEDSES
jgi:hypothetical protein